MKRFVKSIIIVVHIITVFFVVILGGIGFVIDIIGPTIYEKIIKLLDIPWTFKQAWNFSMILFLVFIFTCVLLKLLSKKN